MSTNRILKNRYRIVREIGRGGMGVVYEAHDYDANKSVALKKLLSDEPKQRKAFEREAKRLARLKHPSLPKVMRLFKDHGKRYLPMEYIEGDDLAALLAKQKVPFPLEQVLQWADQLLDLLIYLHGRQPAVVHRDIKPANLKFKQGRIVLLDFGLAKGGLTQHTRVADSLQGFTPVYTPLEQIESQSSDPRVDLYALSATLYHLLTNKLPVDARLRKQASELGLPDPLHSANHLNPDVPSSLADVIAQGMALYPDKRPASAKQMRTLLKECLTEAYQRRAEKLKLFRQALQSEDDERIVAAYDAEFEPDLTPAEREQWQEASQVVALLERMDEAIRAGDERAILKLSKQMPIRPVTTFSEAQRVHIQQTQQRQAAFARFREALKSEDDARIIASYDAQWLDGHRRVSSKQRKSLEQAKKRQSALLEFREALQSQDEDRIEQAYQPQWLNGYVEVLPSERQELARVRRYLAMRARVREAIERDDDQQILQAIDLSLVRSWTGLTEAELARLNLAQQRRAEKLKLFRQALWCQDDERIVAAYHAEFDPDLTPSERKQWQEASQVVRVLAWMDDAISQGNERAILSLSKQMPIRPFTAFSEAQRVHIRQATLRQAAFARFQEALKSEDDAKIIASYDAQWLDGHRRVSSKQRRRLEEAKQRQSALLEFREALQRQDEDRIEQAYQAQWLDGYVEVLPSERQELARVHRYLAMRARVREAIERDDDQQILQAIDQSLVRSWTGLTEAEQARLNLAQQRQVAFQSFKKALESQDYHQIISSYNPILEQSNLLKQNHRQQLEQARKQSGTLRTFRGVLWGKHSQVRGIVNFYESLSDKAKKKLLPAEHERVDVAKEQLARKASRSHRQYKRKSWSS